jgi:hypothetical protein
MFARGYRGLRPTTALVARIVWAIGELQVHGRCNTAIAGYDHIRANPKGD